MVNRTREDYKHKKNNLNMMRHIQAEFKKRPKYLRNKFWQSNETYLCILIDINKFSSFSELYLNWKNFCYKTKKITKISYSHEVNCCNFFIFLT